jgi:hypothetical protein
MYVEVALFLATGLGLAMLLRSDRPMTGWPYAARVGLIGGPYALVSEPGTAPRLPSTQSATVAQVVGQTEYFDVSGGGRN